MSRRLFLAPTTLPDAAPLEFVRAAVEAGYDGVGLRLHRSPNLPFHPVVGEAALIQEMKAALGGLAVLDIYSFYLQPDTAIGRFMAALQLGAEFGAKYALVQGDDADGSRLRDNFARFCEAAASFGLTPAVEFVPARPLATLHQARSLIEGSSACVLVDPLHLARAGHAPQDLKGLELPYAQISDGIAATGERRIPGEGDLPLAELLAVLPRDIPLSVEVMHPKAHDAAWARRVLEGTKRFLATAPAASRRSA